MDVESGQGAQEARGKGRGARGGRPGQGGKGPRAGLKRQSRSLSRGVGFSYVPGSRSQDISFELQGSASLVGATGPQATIVNRVCGLRRPSVRITLDGVVSVRWYLQELRACSARCSRIHLFSGRVLERQPDTGGRMLRCAPVERHGLGVPDRLPRARNARARARRHVIGRPEAAAVVRGVRSPSIRRLILESDVERRPDSRTG